MSDGLHEPSGPLPPDPGWRPALRGVLPFLIPFYALRRKRKLVREGEGPDIIALRRVFLSFLTPPVLFLLVLVAILPSDDPSEMSTEMVSAAVFGAGGLALAAAVWFRRQRLDCATPPDLAQAYSRLLFVKVAFADAAVLFGFVGAFIADALSPYLVGMGLGALGFLVSAPTAGDLRQHDDQLAAIACPHSLRRALYPSDAS